MENGYDLSSFKKQFDCVMKENDSLQTRKKLLMEYAKELLDYTDQLKEIRENLVELARKIDPAMDINLRAPSTNLKPIIAELSDKMVSGTQVTRELISGIYQTLSFEQIGYILTKLQEMSGVQKAYDGKAVRLYR